MTIERTRASSRIRLPTACEGTSTYSIVERIFVGTKLTMTAPSQNGSVLRNPPTGNVLGAWPLLFIFVEGAESLREEALPPASETRSDSRRRRPQKTCPRMGSKLVEVLAPPRGFEPLAGPVLWAL